MARSWSFFGDEGFGFRVGELAADWGEQGVGLGEAGFKGGGVFLQGCELFFVRFSEILCRLFSAQCEWRVFPRALP